MPYRRLARPSEPRTPAAADGARELSAKRRLSCHDFLGNQVRLQLFALAYNLGNLVRRLALPHSVKHWSLTTLREKLVKIGAKVVTPARYVIFQMAEVAIPRRLFAAILERIQRLRRPEVGEVPSG